MHVRVQHPTCIEHMMEPRRRHERMAKTLQMCRSFPHTPPPPLTVQICGSPTPVSFHSLSLPPQWTRDCQSASCFWRELPALREHAPLVSRRARQLLLRFPAHSNCMLRFYAASHRGSRTVAGCSSPTLAYRRMRSLNAEQVHVDGARSNHNDHSDGRSHAARQFDRIESILTSPDETVHQILIALCSPSKTDDLEITWTRVEYHCRAVQSTKHVAISFLRPLT